jgi:hypothetical protein
MSPVRNYRTTTSLARRYISSFLAEGSQGVKLPADMQAMCPSIVADLDLEEDDIGVPPQNPTPVNLGDSIHR